MISNSKILKLVMTESPAVARLLVFLLTLLAHTPTLLATLAPVESYTFLKNWLWVLEFEISVVFFSKVNFATLSNKWIWYGDKAWNSFKKKYALSSKHQFSFYDCHTQAWIKCTAAYWKIWHVIRSKFDHVWGSHLKNSPTRNNGKLV